MFRFIGRKTIRARLVNDSSAWLTPQGLDLQSLRKVAWTVGTESMEIPASDLDLASAEALRGPLLKIGDDWQIIDEAELSRILDFIANTGPEITGGDLVRGMLDPGPPQAFDVEYTAPGELARLMSSIHENGNPGAFSTPSEFRGRASPLPIAGGGVVSYDAQAWPGRVAGR